jgi:hypothetical protein
MPDGLIGLPQPPAVGASALPAGTFTGVTVFVTGAGTGLGKAIAVEFARAGASMAHIRWTPRWPRRMSSWCDNGTCSVPIDPTSRPDENDLPTPFQIAARMSRRCASSSRMPKSCMSMSSSNALCLSGLSLTIVAIAPSTSSRTVPAIGAST